ncbi:MAG TPA: FHA domain-containing protein [Blastocatellia bacterium]|nr:FHA domain-containing protein [Blastocatellia bacterium]
MIKCQNCGTDNLDGSEYCDECGSRLAVAARVNNSGYLPPQPPPPPTFTRDTVTPKPATPYTPPPPPVQQAQITQAPSTPPQSPATPPQAAGRGQAGSPNKTVALRQPSGSFESPEASSSGVRAKLIIQRGGRIGKEFPIINEDSLIGRWDADGGIFPDVDLDQDDPEAKISRRHARIIVHAGQFFIEDLGSTNGTFVNRGQRLLPGNRHPLNHGDEIIVGKTFLKFVLN